MKVCSKCKQYKSTTLFAKNSAKKDGLQTNCRECRKVWFKEHYKENKKYYIEHSTIQKRKLARLLSEIKVSIGCLDCGNKHPAVLDFHHLDSDIKLDNVSHLVIYGSIKKILEEISKCIVLCSNCHRIRHYEDK